MPVQLDHLTRIVDVHWGGALEFLYSGADGMFASLDGREWRTVLSSVPATSLAWVDDVWIAVGPGGSWRSRDGAKTWQGIGAPEFNRVVATKQPRRRGQFAGWLTNDEGDGVVYISHNLGQSWAEALTIPSLVNDDGNETITALSGCGGSFFVCTQRGETISHNGSGMVYSSTGGGFSGGSLVFGPGTDLGSLPGTAVGYSASGVAYDKDSGTFYVTGSKEIRFEGTHQSFMIYSASLVAGGGTVFASAEQSTPGGGQYISAGQDPAGGDGKLVAGHLLYNFGDDSAFLDGEIQAGTVSGQAPLVSMIGPSGGGFVGSFCFKNPTNKNEEGLFACIAFNTSESGGGVYVSSSGGGFTLAHSGMSMDGRAAVAVGKVS